MERNFRTAQDRLVKGMRVAGVQTIEQANAYLTHDYVAWWERELTVEAAHAADAHRRMDKSHDLAASLSHVETRQVRPEYTLRWQGKLYQIERQAIGSGLRGPTCGSRRGWTDRWRCAMVSDMCRCKSAPWRTSRKPLAR